MRKLLLGALLAWPFTAGAEIGYDYLQIDWIADGELEIEGGGETPDYDGFAIEGSVSLHPNLFLTADASSGDLEVGSDTTGLDTLSVGLGGRYGVVGGPAPIDVYGVLSYEELTLGGGVADGYGATAGLRWQPTPALEINPSVGHVDYGEFEQGPGLGGSTGLELDGLRYGVRGVYSVTETVAVVVDYRREALELSEGGASGDLDLDEIRLGVRVNFR